MARPAWDEEAHGGARVAPVASSRAEEGAASSAGKQRRRVIAVGMAGSALAACVLVSLGSSRGSGGAFWSDNGAVAGSRGGGAVELAASNTWPYGRDPNVIRDGPNRIRVTESDDEPLTQGEVPGIIQQFDDAKESMKRVNKFTSDQDDFYDQLSAKLKKLGSGVDEAVAGARADRIKMEASLHKMNEESVATALAKLTKEISDHSNSTERSIVKFESDGIGRIDSMNATFMADLTAKAAEHARDAKSLGEAMQATSRSGRAQMRALDEFNEKTKAQLASIGGNILKLQSTYSSAEQGWTNTIAQTRKEIEAKLEAGLSSEHNAAVTRLAVLKQHLMGLYEEQYKALDAAIDALKVRSDASIDSLKKYDAELLKQVDETKAIVVPDFGDARAAVIQKAQDLAALVSKLNQDIQTATNALNSAHSVTVSEMNAKVNTGVNEIKNMLSGKVGKFTRMRDTVKRWLRDALQEENKSRNFNQKPYEAQIADVQNRFATAETGVAELERLVHILNGENGLDEDSNKNKLANNAK